PRGPSPKRGRPKLARGAWVDRRMDSRPGPRAFPGGLEVELRGPSYVTETPPGLLRSLHGREGPLHRGRQGGQSRVEPAGEVEAKRWPSVRRQRLVVAQRLRGFELAEGERLPGNGEVRFVLGRQDQEHPFVGSALVELPDGVEVPR